jgi:hypothetical protein
VAKPCTLTGTNLFLASSIGATPDFNNSTDVPPDFTGTQLTVPHPANGTLYLQLRDDPATVQTLTLPVTPINQSASQSPATQAPVPPPASPASPPAAQPAKPGLASVPKPDAPPNQ